MNPVPDTMTNSPRERQAQSPGADRGARGNLLPTLAGAVLVLVAAWILLDRWVLARPRPPQPGVRTTTWHRTRDLPQPGGITAQKTTIRAARKYFGGMPSAELLAEYRAAGLCDAFHDYLMPEAKERVDAAVAELDQVLDEVGDACDDAIAEAKKAIRGTSDEFVHRADRTREENEKGMRAFLAQAKGSGDICVSDSWGGATRNYRIRREAHPDVYELRRQDADLNEIRRERVHEETAELLARHGADVLDRGEIERVWAEMLAKARRH